MVIAIALFGTALTALFAAAAIFLRGYLEEGLIGNTLQRELDRYADAWYRARDGDAPLLFEFSKIKGRVVGPNRFANQSFDRQRLPNGVHRITETGAGGPVTYKLAVRKDANVWFFLEYDVTEEERGRRLLIGALTVAVAFFAILAWVIAFWSSSRVMAPVAELARRLEGIRWRGRHEPLAPHFADDEVGQLASALDDYAGQLTALVERDREFNSDVSHELRTPLAVIQTTTELVMGSLELSDKMRERLKRIERAAKQSTELIAALLLLSRSERQGPQDGEETDVARVAVEVVESLRPQIGNKPVELILESEGRPEVAAPEAVIAVVLNNLVGNAVKYTREGEVRVRVTVDAVIVEDTGPGIRADEAPQLFERHVRGSSAGSSQGAGLGLAIVKRLCALYGWTAELEPRGEGGARASLRF
ncbi:MAG: HAMP domain-containing histidine kinase [Xanthomonadales bacterium]|nr:HAMP domain-containing histidine kinase [Xanthomonadales bacterium]MCE7931415.1 sensor histidine kinase [Xanthomonadales bacterium PRO6]